MRQFLTTLALTILFTPAARAEEPIALKDFRGAIDLKESPAPFTLAGQVAPLGAFTSRGEVCFSGSPGNDSRLGQGVLVLRVAGGDQLVGVATWTLGPARDGVRAFLLHVAWRDAVVFADGTASRSTGRFAVDRPADMTAQGIIAILIGLIAPR
jgi:hypothetical protein